MVTVWQQLWNDLLSWLWWSFATTQSGLPSLLGAFGRTDPNHIRLNVYHVPSILCKLIVYPAIF